MLRTFIKSSSNHCVKILRSLIFFYLGCSLHADSTDSLKRIKALLPVNQNMPMVISADLCCIADSQTLLEENLLCLVPGLHAGYLCPIHTAS